jgi:hypothetical protein
MSDVFWSLGALTGLQLGLVLRTYRVWAEVDFAYLELREILRQGREAYWLWTVR